MSTPRLFSPALLLTLLALAGGVSASELPAVIGHVRTVEGEAYFASRGQTNAAHVGQAILQGGTLSTGAGGAVGVVLDDGSRLSLGPRSELRLERFEFSPTRGALGLGLWLERGSLALAGGELARLAPGRVRLETPKGTVGLLGPAEVLVRVTP